MNDHNGEDRQIAFANAINTEPGSFERDKARLLAEIDEVANSILAASIVDCSLAAVLDEVEAVVDSFMAMSAEQRVAVVLWCAHTWATEAFDVVAYLFITSAEKRCGKSLLLDMLELLV